MGFAVGHVQRAGRVGEHPVRTRQLAIQRRRFRAVSSHARAQHRRDHTARQIDTANDMVLGIRDEELSRPVREPLGPTQFRVQSRPAIAGVALLSGPGEPMQRLGPPVDAQDRVAFAQRQIQIAIGGDRHRPRAAQRGAADRRLVGRVGGLASARVGLDDAGVEMQPADPLVADVADQEGAVAIEHDAVRLTQLRLHAGPFVPAEARDSGPGDRRDDAALRIHSPDHVVVALGDVEVPRLVELDFVRHVQGGLRGRPAVAVVALLSAAGDRRDGLRLRIEAADALVVEIAEVERAVGPEDEAVRVVHLRV